MILTAEDISWISHRLNKYDIKYQEIFDELNDHLITAIEDLRQNGDQRPFDLLFNQVVSTQFPGYWPFEEIVKSYQSAYRKRIGKNLRANLRYYLNWQTVPLLLLLNMAAFYIPKGKAVAATISVALFALAIITVGYTYFKGRKIKTDKGKQSLLKNYLMTYANLSVAILNVLFDIVLNISKSWQPLAFLNPVHYAPVFFTLMLSFFIIYMLACMRLTKQVVG